MDINIHHRLYYDTNNIDDITKAKRTHSFSNISIQDAATPIIDISKQLVNGQISEEMARSQLQRMIKDINSENIQNHFCHVKRNPDAENRILITGKDEIGKSKLISDMVQNTDEYLRIFNTNRIPELKEQGKTDEEIMAMMESADVIVFGEYNKNVVEFLYKNYERYEQLKNDCSTTIYMEENADEHIIALQQAIEEEIIKEMNKRTDIQFSCDLYSSAVDIDVDGDGIMDFKIIYSWDDEKIYNIYNDDPENSIKRENEVEKDYIKTEISQKKDEGYIDYEFER